MRKRKSAKERKRTFPRKYCKQPGLKQPGCLGTPNFSLFYGVFSEEFQNYPPHQKITPKMSLAWPKVVFATRCFQHMCPPRSAAWPSGDYANTTTSFFSRGSWRRKGSKSTKHPLAKIPLFKRSQSPWPFLSEKSPRP